MRDVVAVRTTLGAFAWRLVILAPTWWVLVEGEATAALFGVPVVAVAAALSVRLSKRRSTTGRLRASGLPALVYFFALGSLRGGWDVALRAFSLRGPVSPRIIEHPTALAPGPPRWVFASIVTLMPGTLCVDASGPVMRIHVLVDSGDAVRRELRALEGRVAAVLTEPEGEGAEADA